MTETMPAKANPEQDAVEADQLADQDLDQVAGGDGPFIHLGDVNGESVDDKHKDVIR